MSVYGTGGTDIQRVAAFLGSRLPITIPLAVAARYYHVSANQAYFTTQPIPTRFNQHFHPLACRSFLRPCITCLRRYGNINPLSIGCAYRLPLRPRLTLIRLALIRNPGSYGELVSHQFYRYLCLHLLFWPLHCPLPGQLLRNQNAPLPDNNLKSLHPQLRCVS